MAYEDIVERYIEIIEYATRNSDCFGFLINPNRLNEKQLKTINSLKPYLIRQVNGISEWPRYPHIYHHVEMNAYRCCPEARKALLELPNIFSPYENNLPEDICFFRGDAPWLITVYHEEMAFLNNATEEDIDFLIFYYIRFWRSW